MRPTMKQRDARGAKARPSGTGAGSSSSTKRRGPGRPPKSQAKASAHGSKSRAHNKNLTASRVASIIDELDNKRGSTMSAIRSKLHRSGLPANMGLIRHALERAVSAGLLREVKEERFSLPSSRGGNLSGSASASSAKSRRSRSRAASVKKTTSSSVQKKLKGSPSAARSGSSSDSRRRQRRPLQGRRSTPPADTGSSSLLSAEDAEHREEEDAAGQGNGDVEEPSSELLEKEGASSRVSVTEPVTGCDAVMVFGTR